MQIAKGCGPADAVPATNLNFFIKHEKVNINYLKAHSYFSNGNSNIFLRGKVKKNLKEINT